MFSRLWRDRVEKTEHSLGDLTQRVHSLERQIDRSEAQSEAYRTTIAMLREEQTMLVSAHQDAIRAFQKVSDQYTEGLARARDTIEELSAVNMQLSRPFRNTPLHKTEEEEDLEFQLDHGVIDMSQYNEALRMAGLTND